jgi:hypothetical protein
MENQSYTTAQIYAAADFVSLSKIAVFAFGKTWRWCDQARTWIRHSQ